MRTLFLHFLDLGLAEALDLHQLLFGCVCQCLKGVHPSLLELLDVRGRDAMCLGLGEGAQHALLAVRVWPMAAHAHRGWHQFKSCCMKLHQLPLSSGCAEQAGGCTPQRARVSARHAPSARRSAPTCSASSGTTAPAPAAT